MTDPKSILELAWAIRYAVPDGDELDEMRINARVDKLNDGMTPVQRFQDAVSQRFQAIRLASELIIKREEVRKSVHQAKLETIHDSH